MPWAATTSAPASKPRQANVLERLADERNRGRKTMDKIARSMVDNSGVNPPEDDGYGPRAGLCLEPQRFPKALNHSKFTKSRLGPGEVYSKRVRDKFTADQS